MPAGTRERALEAALELLGSEGVRALSHARVDLRAGLPPGSTSNWFRTRRSLLGGLVDWIAERERADFDPAAMPMITRVEDLVEGLCVMTELLTGPRAKSHPCALRPLPRTRRRPRARRAPAAATPRVRAVDRAARHRRRHRRSGARDPSPHGACGWTASSQAHGRPCARAAPRDRTRGSRLGETLTHPFDEAPPADGWYQPVDSARPLRAGEGHLLSPEQAAPAVFRSGLRGAIPHPYGCGSSCRGKGHG